MSSDIATTESVTIGVFLGFGPLIGLITFFFLNMDGVGSIYLVAILLSYPVGAIPALLSGLIFIGLTKATERASAKKSLFRSLPLYTELLLAEPPHTFHFSYYRPLLDEICHWKPLQRASLREHYAATYPA